MTISKFIRLLLIVGGFALLLIITTTANAPSARPAYPPARVPQLTWRGVHILAPGPDDLPLLKKAIVKVLAPMGVNVVVLEVNYKFQYCSHPELRAPGALSRADARDLAALCRTHSIRLIPQFNCLGHQSWEKVTFPLLANYPEFDETPNIPRGNPGIYCRCWCPLHQKVNTIIFALMDELIDAFQADAFHVGMDEVFLIASPQCPRCRGKDPAALFAKAVNDYHQHLSGQKMTMLMWGDRLLDDKIMGYGEWEASRNGTATAIDQIPKDIIVCDWHYDLREHYPSVGYLQKKGFRVWPTSWKDTRAALALLQEARQGATRRMIGHLCTTWGEPRNFAHALLGESNQTGVPDNAKQSAAALRACMAELARRAESGSCW